MGFASVELPPSPKSQRKLVAFSEHDELKAAATPA